MPVMVTRPQTMQGTMQLMQKQQKAWKGARLAGGQKMKRGCRRMRNELRMGMGMERLQRQSGGSGH
jgi:hypothetical protein